MNRPGLRRYFRHGFLPQLMAFEACLRLGSVTRAAEELSLAQPTVSGLLRKLSETVGEPVLRQRHGRMEATDAGRELAQLCGELFDCLGRYDARRGRRTVLPTMSAAATAARALENFGYPCAS
jgi:DNA-binding transcriptional LysR family regulator